MQLSVPENALRDTQKEFFSLDMASESFVSSVDDSINLHRKGVDDIKTDPSVNHILSTFDYQSHRVVDGLSNSGKPIVTFKGVLSYKTFPLAEILRDLLIIGEKEMGNPIEIEFAVNLNTPKGMPRIFNFLQIRPIVLNDQMLDVDWEGLSAKPSLISSNSALGNGTYKNICDFVYVKPSTFNPAKTKEIAKLIEALNDRMVDEKLNYILVGPGRWGSSDPWLGIPVKWSHISQARLIVESGLDNYKIDPSQEHTFSEFDFI